MKVFVQADKTSSLEVMQTVQQGRTQQETPEPAAETIPEQVDTWGCVPGADDTQDLNLASQGLCTVSALTFQKQSLGCMSYSNLLYKLLAKADTSLCDTPNGLRHSNCKVQRVTFDLMLAGRLRMGENTYNQIYGNSDTTTDISQRQLAEQSAAQGSASPADELLKRADDTLDSLRSAMKSDSPGSDRHNRLQGKSSSKMTSRTTQQGLRVEHEQVLHPMNCLLGSLGVGWISSLPCYCA